MRTPHGSSFRGAVARAALVALAALVATGCSTLLAVKDQQALMDANSVVSGTVGLADGAARGPLVVALLARAGDGYHLVDYFVAERPGPWVLAVQPGTYWVVAFEDVNGNGRYDDEPAYRPAPEQSITLAPGQRLANVAIAIPRDGRLAATGASLAELQALSPQEQPVRSIFALSVAGRVTTLDDPRFAREVADSGMWKPMDFLLDAQPGIWFLEPYDPARIPVLFVHGMGGTPRDFTELIGALDHTRYQAWVAYYPSGAALDNLGRWMAQLYARLRTQYRFQKAAVVAHSMGGLVTRAFLFEDFAATGSDAVRTYVTISSPLGGMASAGKGVEDSPIVVRSWYGLAPGSAFLDGLYWTDPPARTVRRRLPAHMAYHMMFGFHGSGPDDGTVALASQLRPEAQEEARSVRGFDETHTGILKSPAVAARLHEILAELH